MSDTELVENTTVLTPTGKVRGYRPHTWVPIKNTPGRFCWVRKHELRIDKKYQRKTYPGLITRIAANWSWVSCGVLAISSRPGEYMPFIVDGQNRWEAAKLCDNVTELPCFDFELDTVKDEALGFLAVNSERQMPTLADKFRALLIVEDPLAIAAHKLATEYSREIKAPAGPGTISCVHDFMTCLHNNRAAMDRVFPIIAQLCAGQPMPGRIFRGIHGLERRMPRGESLADDRWRDRLVKLGHDAILESIRVVSNIEGHGTERACAQGVLRAINRGLRSPLKANIDVVRR